MTSVRVFNNGGLWSAFAPTRYGVVQILCGEGDAPDCATLLLVERFLGAATDHVAAVRRSAFRLPALWRPIRLAVNNRGQLGLQFKHRLTGAQEGMFFADQHSEFKTLLNHITVSPEDAARFSKPASSDGPGA